MATWSVYHKVARSLILHAHMKPERSYRTVLQGHKEKKSKAKPVVELREDRNNCPLEKSYKIMYI